MMRIIVKRCKVWWGDWRDGVDLSDRDALASWGGLPNPNLGINIICPFCGRRYFSPEGGVSRRRHCACGEINVKAKRVVRKVKRLHKPSKKVRLYCSDCDWTGVWGRAETVRNMRENFGEPLCPECQFGLIVENVEGVPRIVQNPEFC